MLTFTLYPIVEINGARQCGCGAPDCKRTGKHPSERWSQIPADRPELVPAPDRGVGIKTGAVSGIFVVDLDVKNGVDGVEAFAKLGDVPPTRTIATPSGGYHLYFQHPGFPVRTSGPNSNPLAKGVDVRGDGGYVVAPGSPHANGGRYEVVADLPIAVAPAWLLARPELQHIDSELAGPATEAEALAARVPRDWRIDRAKAWLAQQPPAVAGQGGDGHTFQLLTRAVHEWFLTDGDMIADAFATWNARCDPPWGGAEWAHKVDSVLHHSTIPWNTTINMRYALEQHQPATATPEKGASGPFRLTDSGNAERFATQHANRVRFVADWNAWLTWDGTRWRPDKTGAVARLAKETARSINREIDAETDDDRRKQLRAWAGKSEGRAGRENMIALARSEQGIAAAAQDFDADLWLLNVANGTLDLRTMQIHPHARENMITKLSPATFDPNATAPIWDAFLSRVMGGNADLIGYLQRLTGYALTGSTREQIFAFSYGDGANGKSVFHRTIERMLGDYAVTASDSLFFVAKGDGGHPTSIASLAGARFVLCSEIPEDKRFHEQLLKNMTGGDSITTRRLYENEWQFTPTAKLFFAGNHKPVIKGTDGGIWRRVRLIPWTVVIPRNERDSELEHKLQAELPGILAWAVRGCAAWRDRGLGNPPDVERATAGYREESDPMAQFFRERCEFGGEFKVTRQALRRAYEAWCGEQGAMPFGPKKVGDALRRRGAVDGGTMRVGPSETPVDAWLGVRLTA